MMKNFRCFLCLLLCVLQCVFSSQSTTDDEMQMLAKAIGITVQDLQECLNKVSTDLETMMELNRVVWDDSDAKISPERITKIGCFGACIYKKTGVLANSKIILEKFMELTTRGDRDPPSYMNMVRATAQECSNRVLSKTDECDIVFSFSGCLIQEIRKCRGPDCL